MPHPKYFKLILTLIFGLSLWGCGIFQKKSQPAKNKTRQIGSKPTAKVSTNPGARKNDEPILSTPTPASGTEATSLKSSSLETSRPTPTDPAPTSDSSSAPKEEPPHVDSKNTSIAKNPTANSPEPKLGVSEPSPVASLLKTLNLVIERYSEESEFKTLVPGKAGTLVYADGKKMGVLDSKGTLTLSIPQETKVILVVGSRTEAGVFRAPFKRDLQKETRWKLKDEVDSEVDADFIMEGSEEGLISPTLPKLSLKFVDGHDQQIKMAYLLSADIATEKHKPSKLFATLNDEFWVAKNGMVESKTLSKVRALILQQKNHELELEIHCLGVDQKQYFGLIKLKVP